MLRCLLQPCLFAKDSILATLKAGEFLFLTLAATGTGGFIFRNSKEFTDDYIKVSKELLIKLVRLAIRIVQSVPNFFGHLAGLLIHPIIGKWVEQQTAYLDRYKFLRLPAQLETLFKQKNNHIPNYSYTPPISSSKFEPTKVPPPPELEEDGEFYKPDFTDPTDYHRIFGLSKDKYSESEIKKRYHKLALRFHPDKNQEEGAEEKFKMIDAARAALFKNPGMKKTPAVNPTSPISAPNIVLPAENLADPLFVKASEICLTNIILWREFLNIDPKYAIDRCIELIDAIKSRRTKNEIKDKLLQNQLLFLENMASAYHLFSTEFVITQQMLKEGQTKADPFQQMIAKLNEKGKPTLDSILKPSPKDSSNLALIKISVGFLFFDKMNALYLSLTHSFNNQKKPFEAISIVNEYRRTIASKFYHFVTLRKLNTTQYQGIKSPRTSILIPKTATNACKNYKSMVSLGHEFMFHLRSEFV